MPTALTAIARAAASAPPSPSSAATVVLLKTADSAGDERAASMADAPTLAMDATPAPAAATASAAAPPGAVADASTAAAADSGVLTNALEGTAMVDVTVCKIFPASARRTFEPSDEGVGVTVSDTISPPAVNPIAVQETTPVDDVEDESATLPGMIPDDAAADDAHARASALATTASASAPLSARATVAVARNAEDTF
jgi:hypothetical protein